MRRSGAIPILNLLNELVVKGCEAVKFLRVVLAFSLERLALVFTVGAQSTQSCNLIFHELHGQLSGPWVGRGVLEQCFFISAALFLEEIDCLLGSLETGLKDVVLIFGHNQVLLKTWNLLVLGGSIWRHMSEVRLVEED